VKVRLREALASKRVFEESGRRDTREDYGVRIVNAGRR
jgi:hypothetical protein